jgi:hypothetical protein
MTLHPSLTREIMRQIQSITQWWVRLTTPQSHRKSDTPIRFRQEPALAPSTADLTLGNPQALTGHLFDIFNENGIIADTRRVPTRRAPGREKPQDNPTQSLDNPVHAKLAIRLRRPLGL